MESPSDHDNPPSRLSPETLELLEIVASPTRISVYDRPWFVWGLVALAIGGIALYFALMFNWF